MLQEQFAEVKASVAKFEESVERESATRGKQIAEISGTVTKMFNELESGDKRRAQQLSELTASLSGVIKSGSLVAIEGAGQTDGIPCELSILGDIQKVLGGPIVHGVKAKFDALSRDTGANTTDLTSLHKQLVEVERIGDYNATQIENNFHRIQETNKTVDALGQTVGGYDSRIKHCEDEISTLDSLKDLVDHNSSQITYILGVINAIGNDLTSKVSGLQKQIQDLNKTLASLTVSAKVFPFGQNQSVQVDVVTWFTKYFAPWSRSGGTVDGSYRADLLDRILTWFPPAVAKNSAVMVEASLGTDVTLYHCTHPSTGTEEDVYFTVGV